MKKLTPKQKRFCEEYTIDFNATQAAIRAGYSKRTAYATASRMLRNVKVQTYISELTKKASDKAEISAERVLREYVKLAFTDLTDLVDMSTGRPIFKDLASIEPDHLAALQGVSETVTGLKFKMHDKKGALDSLAKHLGLFSENNKRELEMKVGKITEEDAEFVKKIFDDITEE